MARDDGRRASTKPPTARCASCEQAPCAESCGACDYPSAATADQTADQTTDQQPPDLRAQCPCGFTGDWHGGATCPSCGTDPDDHTDDETTTCPTCGETFLHWQAPQHQCCSPGNR